MVQEMSFKDKARDHIHARDSHLQKKKTIQMRSVDKYLGCKEEDHQLNQFTKNCDQNFT